MKTNTLFYFSMTLFGLLILSFLGTFIFGKMQYRSVDLLYKNIDSNEYFSAMMKQYPNQDLQRSHTGFGVEYRVSQEATDRILFQHAKTNEVRLICAPRPTPEAENTINKPPLEERVTADAFKERIATKDLCKKDVYHIWILE